MAGSIMMRHDMALSGRGTISPAMWSIATYKTRLKTEETGDWAGQSKYSGRHWDIRTGTDRPTDDFLLPQGKAYGVDVDLVGSLDYCYYYYWCCCWCAVALIIIIITIASMQSIQWDIFCPAKGTHSAHSQEARRTHTHRTNEIKLNWMRANAKRQWDSLSLCTCECVLNVEWRNNGTSEEVEVEQMRRK